MSLRIRRLTPAFAGEVSGVDTARPLPPGVAAEIDAGMAEHGVLVFPRPGADGRAAGGVQPEFRPARNAVGGVQHHQGA